MRTVFWSVVRCCSLLMVAGLVAACETLTPLAPEPAVHTNTPIANRSEAPVVVNPTSSDSIYWINRAAADSSQSPPVVDPTSSDSVYWVNDEATFVADGVHYRLVRSWDEGRLASIRIFENGTELSIARPQWTGGAVTGYTLTVISDENTAFFNADGTYVGSTYDGRGVGIESLECAGTTPDFGGECDEHKAQFRHHAERAGTAFVLWGASFIPGFQSMAVPAAFGTAWHGGWAAKSGYEWYQCTRGSGGEPEAPCRPGDDCGPEMSRISGV